MRDTLQLIELKPTKHTLQAKSLQIGLRGLPGIQGEQGPQGDAVIGPAGKEGKSLRGLPGKDGKGLKGKPGKDGKGIDDIIPGPGGNWLLIKFTDGTEQTVKLLPPKGTLDDPKWLMPSAADATVRDILAGENITIEEDDYGRFTISGSGGEVFHDNTISGKGTEIDPLQLYGVVNSFIDRPITIGDNQVMINRPLTVSHSQGGSVTVKAGGEVLILKDGLS